MPLKAVSIDLEEDLHTKVKAAGSLRNQKLTEVYTEALNRWLAWIEGSGEASPFGPISADEERMLRGILAFVQDPERNPILERLIRDVSKMYTKRESATQ